MDTLGRRQDYVARFEGCRGLPAQEWSDDVADNHDYGDRNVGEVNDVTLQGSTFFSKGVTSKLTMPAKGK